MKKCCPFGALLREERNKKDIPLWQLAAKIPFPASNMQRIETGITEPRLILAMKILGVLEVDAGNFMLILAEWQGWQKYEIPDGFIDKKFDLSWQNLATEDYPYHINRKALFGFYFRKLRKFLGLSQNTIAERAAYTNRSVILVEQGQQEPLVMRALQLIWVTGFDVKVFFENYAAILNPMD